MKSSHSPSLSALALALLVGACAPVTSYTDAEAPKNLTLDSSTAQVDLRFAPGTAALAAADAARLVQLAATGRITPSDRVTIAAAGAPSLAGQRFGSAAALLLHYGIVPVAVPPVAVAANHAVVEITRTLVTLPPCPNWSKSSRTNSDNQSTSNFGCATETNLGMMVASPSDLASGLPPGRSVAGQPAGAAVTRYLTDQVQLPSVNTALPVASTGTTPTPSGSGNGTGTGTGTGGS